MLMVDSYSAPFADSNEVLLVLVLIFST